MRRTPIESTSLVSVGYDAAAHTLEVEFDSGAVYRYFMVPEHVYRELLDADSPGRYMNEHVRTRYPHERD